jgi:acyl carrier protein
MNMLEPAAGVLAAPPEEGDAARFADFVELVGQIAPIDLAPGAVTRASTLAGDLMLDSISLISLMALAEGHFGLVLSEHAEAVANLRTVGDALDLLARLDAARA